jgi:quercetin dioxygenase-like cupin family protein
VLLDRAGTDPLGTNRSAREPLQAGDVRILQGAKDHYLTIQNSSGDPAALWVFSTGRSAIGESSAPEATPEPGPSALVAFLPVQRPSSTVGEATQLSITRLVLPPGATVPVHELGAIEEIAVLDGALEVTVGAERALLCSDGAAQPFGGTETVATGEGVSARESTSLGYHVTGLQPATILVMRLQLASD